MTPQVCSLISEAKSWLSSQPAPEENSEAWFALGNFRAFISAIEVDPSLDGIDRAVWVLRHRLTDQYDWSITHCQVFSSFCERAKSIASSERA